jgi:hypothetical protein
LVLILCYSAEAVGQKTVFTYNTDGTYADINPFSSGNTFGTLQVNRGGVGTNAQTFLFLSMTTFDPNFNVLVSYFGYGVIPNSSLQGDGTGTIKLDLDLSTAPNFNLCTYTPGTGTSCSPSSQGTITLTWNRNNVWSSHTVDNISQSYPGVKWTQTGSSDNGSASVQGTILGTDLTSTSFTFGSIGSQHSAGHTVTLQ